MIKPIGIYIKHPTFKGAHRMPSRMEGVSFAIQIFGRLIASEAAAGAPTVR
jgi:hypothetical protein